MQQPPAPPAIIARSRRQEGHLLLLAPGSVLLLWRQSAGLALLLALPRVAMLIIYRLLFAGRRRHVGTAEQRDLVGLASYVTRRRRRRRAQRPPPPPRSHDTRINAIVCRSSGCGCRRDRASQRTERKEEPARRLLAAAAAAAPRVRRQLLLSLSVAQSQTCSRAPSFCCRRELGHCRLQPTTRKTSVRSQPSGLLAAKSRPTTAKGFRERECR